MHWIQGVSTSYGLCCIVQLDCSLGSEHMAATVCSVLALTPCSQCILPGFKHFSPDSRLDAVSGSAFRLFTNSVLLKKHNGLVMKKWRLFIFVCHHSQCGNNKLVYLWIKIHLNIFLLYVLLVKVWFVYLYLLILYMRSHKISRTDSDRKWKRFRGALIVVHCSSWKWKAVWTVVTQLWLRLGFLELWWT